MATISVIVPVYKVEAYLHRCVDSILGQTFTDFELILVDDGSPDDCPVICDEYAGKDSRVHVIHLENGGPSAARNAGIDWAFANSDSQWLTFVDSDDWIHPEMLERLLNAAVESNVAVSICGYAETTGEEPEIHAEDLIPEIWSPEDFFIEHNVNVAVAWGKLYRRECFRIIRYPVGKIHEDEFTTYQVLFQLNKVAVIPGQMYWYFQNQHGIMKSPWTPKRLSALEAHKEQIEFFENLNFDRARLRSAKALIWQIKSQIDVLTQLQPKEKNHILSLRKSLRHELRQYRKELSLSPATTSDLYEAAYPRLMKLFWICKAGLMKLHIQK